MNDEYKWLKKLTNKTLKEVFEGKVAEVVLDYKIIYKSFAGEDIRQRREVITENMPANFYFECPNPECTESYFDLRDEVNSLFRGHQESAQGEKYCKGKVAPDHPNQRCDTTIFYEIRIIYSE